MVFWRYPRPQFGFLPWFAFFFALSLRFTVRFDMGSHASSCGSILFSGPSRVRPESTRGGPEPVGVFAATY